MKNLRINEVFLSIQGEGKTVGQPRLFIRLSGCNLSCRFCDSKYHTKANYQDDEVLAEATIYHNDKWVITGGEPLLQEKEITKTIDKYHPKWVEIETNGTIQPSNKLIKRVNLWNVSPKDIKDQERDQNVNLAVNFQKLNDYIIKLVYVNKNSEEFIFNTIQKHKIDNSKVYIMAEGKKKVKQEKMQKRVVEFCLKNDFNYSPRLHTLIWNNERAK